MRNRRGRAEKEPFLHACTGRGLRISRVDLKQCRSTACHYQPQQSNGSKGRRRGIRCSCSCLCVAGSKNFLNPFTRLLLVFIEVHSITQI